MWRGPCSKELWVTFGAEGGLQQETKNPQFLTASNRILLIAWGSLEVELCPVKPLMTQWMLGLQLSEPWKQRAQLSSFLTCRNCEVMDVFCVAAKSVVTCYTATVTSYSPLPLISCNFSFMLQIAWFFWMKILVALRFLLCIKSCNNSPWSKRWRLHLPRVLRIVLTFSSPPYTSLLRPVLL